MNRKYFQVPDIVKQHPGYRLYVLITPAGRSINWHISEPMPEGKFALIATIE